MERGASQLEAEEVVERHESAHQQKALGKEHQLGGCPQILGEPMTKAAFGIGVVAQHRGESARIGCELDEPHGRQPAEHRDGEEIPPPPPSSSATWLESIRPSSSPVVGPPTNMPAALAACTGFTSSVR